MSIRKIKLTLAESVSDKEQAKFFAHQLAQYWYQCTPSEIPDYIYTAKENNQLLSTVGVTFHKENHILPIRELYQINKQGLPLDFAWENIAQFNWFFSKKKGVFPLLLLEALRFSHKQRAKYGILQMKENIFNILSHKGFHLIQIPDATLLLKTIPDDARAYYEEDIKIHVYYFNILNNIVSIEAYIQDMMSNTIARLPIGNINEDTLSSCHSL